MIWAPFFFGGTISEIARNMIVPRAIRENQHAGFLASQLETRHSWHPHNDRFHTKGSEKGRQSGVFQAPQIEAFAAQTFR